MNHIELRHECSLIDEIIQERYVDPAGRCQPIPDGIVDVDRYLAAPLKVLWILKEPYDSYENGIPSGGGWDYRSDLVGHPEFYQSRGRDRATWYPITYVTYALLNDFVPYDEMSRIPDDPSMMGILKSAAFINVKKLPGLTQSSGRAIAQAYMLYRKVLLRQLKVYAPDVIIGGYTLHLFKDDLSLTYLPKFKTNSIEVAFTDHQVFIDAYHPSQRKVKRHTYVNDIVRTVQRAIGLGMIV